MAQYTEQDLTNIREAIVGGVLTCRIGETTVIYRSQADLMQVMRMIQEDLGDVPASGSVRMWRPVTGKGL